MSLRTVPIDIKNGTKRNVPLSHPKIMLAKVFILNHNYLCRFILGNLGERKTAMEDTRMEKNEKSKPKTKKYEKPVMEVVEVKNNLILTSEEPVTPCWCNIGIGF